jgi:hypothetical protein
VVVPVKNVGKRAGTIVGTERKGGLLYYVIVLNSSTREQDRWSTHYVTPIDTDTLEGAMQWLELSR